MINFRVSDTLTIYSNSILVLIKLCRNASIQVDLSKNNGFSTEKAIRYIPRTKKRKKVPVRGMLDLLHASNFIMGTEKIIAYRGRSTIPTLSKLKLFCQYEMTSRHHTVTNSIIIDYIHLWFVCFMQNVTKKFKI